MKLLVVEDNRALAASLKRQLGKQFVMDIAPTGEEGLRLGMSGGYDVIILDLELPDKNGFEVCKKLRANSVKTPILILTANKQLNSRVDLLDSGADDYVTKPFHVVEIRARLHALLRRAANDYKTELLEVNDLVIDVRRRHVKRAGQDITLRRKEFDILEYLARNRGRAVTRSMILDYAWEAGSEGWNNTVDVHIKHLRDKIDKPFKSSFIKTAYGIGYMLDDA